MMMIISIITTIAPVNLFEDSPHVPAEMAPKAPRQMGAVLRMQSPGMFARQPRDAQGGKHQGGHVDQHHGPHRDDVPPQEAEGDPGDGHGAEVVGDGGSGEEKGLGFAPPRRIASEKSSAQGPRRSTIAMAKPSLLTILAE
jgi:hypothetical protein